MQTLSDFIASRLAELDREESPLRAKLDAIVAERDQLHRAAEAAGLQVFGLALPAPSDAGEVAAPRRRRVAAEATIKDAVIEVLRDRATGMTAIDILSWVNRRLGVDYPRTSLSPQLSRLKAEGKITRDGNVWSLVPAQLVQDSQKETHDIFR